MSPPDKTLEQDVAPAPTVAQDVAPDTAEPGRQDVLTGLQEAGNRALSSLFGARGVQRAPNDDDPRRTSGMAHAPTVDPRTQAQPNVASPMTEAPTVPPPDTIRASIRADTGASSVPPPVRHAREAPRDEGTVRATYQADTGATSIAPPVVHPKEGGGSGSGAPGGPAPGGPAPGGPAPGGPAPGGGPPRDIPGRIPARRPIKNPPVRTKAEPEAPFGSTPYPGGGDPRFDVGGKFGPQKVEPGQAGGVAKKVWVDTHPREVYVESQVEEAYRKDPSKVIRSTDVAYHKEAWRFQGGEAAYGKDKPTPRIWRVGGYFYVHPDYEGQATSLPNIRGSETGPGNVAPGTTGGTGGAGGQTGGTGGQQTPAPAPNKLRQAAAPENSWTGQPRGTQKAQPATFSEVKAALEADPTKVVRSPNNRWHRQGYRLDGGGAEAPPAFRVGDLYVIGPDYPGMKSVPKLGDKIPDKPSALPPVAQLVSLPGVAYDEKAGGRSYQSNVTQVGDRTEVRDRKRELSPVHAQLVTGHEVKEGDTTRRKENKIAAGFGQGGGLVGAQIGGTETVKTGETQSTTKGWNASLAATKDEKIGLNVSRPKEQVVGQTQSGEPIKKSSNLSGGATYDPTKGEVGANVAYKTTSPTGTSKTATGGMTMDDKGGASVNAGGALESKSGNSISTSLNASSKVVADEPVEQPDGSFLVTYRIEDTIGGSIGGGKRFGPQGSGRSMGGTFGKSSTDFHGGTKAFPSREAADAWRKDAGPKIRAEQALEQYIPVTTAAGALMIPVGSSRTSGETDATNWGVSGTMGGSTLGYSNTKTSTTSLEIRHVKQNVMEVTGGVMGTKTGDISLSNPVFGNTKGTTTAKMFAVTWSFDLTTPAGKQAFERYCKTGIPIPGGTFRYLDTGSSEEDHDNYKIPFVGTASWSGTTWETSREDAAGNFQKSFGGKQSHEVKPGVLGRFTGDVARSSNAQIVRQSENFEEKTARAELKVAGKAGSFNRAEFGKIFTDRRGGRDMGEASGEWTLSAEVPLERIKELEENNKELRNAMNIDERMRIYSRLVKEGGAQMLGGQVGMLSKSWDLELKGNPSFPGARERTRLNLLRDRLFARLKGSPGDAYSIAREAKETLDRLEVRLADISKENKYTDLPDGLRQQQKDLVKSHIDDFTRVRQNALAVGIRGGQGESYDDVQKRATAKHGYDQVKLVDRERKKVEDSVFLKDKQTTATFSEIRTSSKALGDVISKKGKIALRNLTNDEDRAGAKSAYDGTMLRIKSAYELGAKEQELKKQVEKLREEMDKTTDPAQRLTHLKGIDKAMTERLAILKQMLGQVQAAGAIIAPWAQKEAMSSNTAFWRAVGGEP